jgi:tRNA threonylcarbamoyl adenosine modification protein YeaZ
MMQIAIDTSTDTASLAVVQDNEILGEMTWRSHQNHSVQLLPNLAHLLKLSGLKLQSADCIIVAKGPGSFNGLRVGVSTAKGLAFSLGIPIVGVSTLEAAAYAHAGTGLPVCAIMNAGREEIGAATYQQQDGEWRQLVATRLSTIESLCSEIVTETVFCGEMATAAAVKLKERLGNKAVIASPAASLRRSGFLAQLGLRRLKAGEDDDVATLHPFYFRGPPITERKRA